MHWAIGLESLRLATLAKQNRYRIVHIMRGIVLLAATLLLGCLRLTAADASCEDASLLQVPKIGEVRRPLNLAVIDPGQHWSCFCAFDILCSNTLW
jgi:hypothetical protein